jgi:hypothetical protein
MPAVSLVKINTHSWRWRVDFRVDPPRIEKWDQSQGWMSWDAETDDQRALTEELLTRARAMRL